MDASGKFIPDKDIETIKVMLSELSHEKFRDRYLKTAKAIGLITHLLTKVNIRPVIVGGHAVELYTLGSYATMDVDLVLSGRDLAGQVLEKLGFEKGGNRHWYFEPIDLAIEIPDNVLAGSEDKVTKVQIDDNYNIFVIGIEDLILDRLRACVHWQSTSDCEWAERLLCSAIDSIDFEYLENETKKDSQMLYEIYLKIKRELS